MNPIKHYSVFLSLYIKENYIKNLEHQWADPVRYYHTKEHLNQIIQDIQKNIWFSTLQAHEKVALLLAAFFHDAIYDPQRKDNEEKSKAYFLHACKFGDSPTQKLILDLIEVTKYRKRPVNRLQQIFWDADNAIFKKSYPVLVNYEKQIRKEFIHIPKEKYKIARIKFLESNFGLFNQTTENNLKKLINYVENTY